MSRPVPMRPSAGADVLTLTSALARAGWGETFAAPLFRGARVMLRELATAMFEARQGRRASIDITGPQLADRTGYSDRWVRESLATLEGLGLIEWYRGGIVEGAPKPSLIRIVKGVLADFVLAARCWHDDVLDARIVAVKARIKATTIWRLCRGRKRRRDPHAEVASILPLFEGRKGARASRPSAPEPKIPTNDNVKEKDMRAAPEYMRYLATTCTHGGLAPDRCNRCKYEAIQRLERVKEATKVKAERQAYEEAREVPWEDLYPRAYVEYMKAKHPGTNHHSWPRLQLNDPRAKELLLNG
nr:MAG TPA: RNA polymerase III subunit [Caudoviricetes sp.]